LFKKFFIVLVLLIGFSLYLFDKWTTDFGPLQQTVVVLVPKGAGSRQVASMLDEAGVIDKPLVFRILARIKGFDVKFKAGEYEFSAQISMVNAMQKMVNGDMVYHRITLPEGRTTRQFLDIINDNSLLSGDITLKIGEGEMLPETYTFTRGTPRDDIISQAKAAMEKVVAEAWKNRAPDLPIENAREMVILASIIEKETAVPAERGLVASVFVNRLLKRMPLQTDPTVIYALTKGQQDLGRALTHQDLKIDDAYNTYVYGGLPPGPICNPSRESLQKAANPDVSDYLYFVANGQGGHHFSKTLDEHNNKVAEWKKIRSSQQ